jgi:hypothetical protein
MLDPKHFKIIVGESVVAIIRAMHVGNDLVASQERVFALGYRGVEVMLSPVLGTWSIRSDTGIDGFRLYYRGIMSTLEAEMLATRWVNEDPERRYAFKRI